jgi:CubicO group peptidase (beta-lactamase class C family)
MTSPTTTLAESLSGIDELLAAASARYRVPGATLAVRQGDEVVEFATGLLNLTTRVETTTDSVFQIGSITKVFTTTLIMQLVDEGRVALDAPVQKYVPEFLIADRAYGAAITVRQLLTHTSGIDGDYFHDTGRGADAVERFVLSLGALPSLHAPGTMWSYCNAGFPVAGRIVEKLTGMSWDDAIRERIFKPAGLTTMGTLPEQAILQRAAAGHVMTAEGQWSRAPVWLLAPSNGPAGATPFAAARDLLTFGWTHLNGGKTADEKTLLAEGSVRAMQAEEVHLPGRGLAAHWGLGWMLFDWGKDRIIGHDGGTIGQSSFLRLSPSKRFGVALLTNGGNTQGFSRAILGDVFSRAAGITLPPLPEPNPDVTVDPARYVGTYRKLSSRTDVVEENGALVATMTQTGSISAPPAVIDLQPIDDADFATVIRGTRLRGTLTFLEPGLDGRFEYVRDSRLSRRVHV